MLYLVWYDLQDPRLRELDKWLNEEYQEFIQSRGVDKIIECADLISVMYANDLDIEFVPLALIDVTVNKRSFRRAYGKEIGKKLIRQYVAENISVLSDALNVVSPILEV